MTLAHLTLQTPRLHGAIFAWYPDRLRIDSVRIQETLWSGLRTFGLEAPLQFRCGAYQATLVDGWTVTTRAPQPKP